MARNDSYRVVIDFDDYHRFLTSLKSTTDDRETKFVNGQRAILQLLIDSLADFQETVTDER